MNELLYDRQKDLPLNQIPSAIVVGCGGTGSWVALYLALSGCLDLHLFDPDRLEIHNFNRLYLSPDDLGKLKTEAVADYIKTRRPDCMISIYGRATTYNLFEVPDGDFFFDCTDNQDTQVMLSHWAKENNRIYIRCGYDGTHVSVVDSVPEWKTSDEPATGYETRPSWVVPAALAACFAVARAMYCSSIEVRADLNEFTKGRILAPQEVLRNPLMREVTMTEQEYRVRIGGHLPPLAYAREALAGLRRPTTEEIESIIIEQGDINEQKT